jgi:hypothetical protein
MTFNIVMNRPGRACAASVVPCHFNFILSTKGLQLVSLYLFFHYLSLWIYEVCFCGTGPTRVAVSIQVVSHKICFKYYPIGDHFSAFSFNFCN